MHLTDVTQGLSAVNLAGPRAREIMGKVTELDCSAEGFTYLDGKQAEVAGVPCLILRIGFVGEVGYEIHCPAAQGEHLWDALMEAGREFGVKPFGLEPQRLLRLQKMHILIGQDTDSESTPFGAAMPWIVKLDKEQDFIGKWALQHYENEQLETALVGFTLSNGHVPTEGAVVMPENGGPMGQVTSARYSQQLGRVIGMAWVPAALAKDGARITISDEDQRDRGRGPDEALLRPRRGDPALVSAAAANPLAFLSPGPAAVAKSPMEPGTVAAGADDRAARRLERGHRVRRCRRRTRTLCVFGRLRRPLAPRQARAPGRHRGHHRSRPRARTRTSCRRRLVVPLLGRARGRPLPPVQIPRRSATASSRPPRAPTASRA